MPIDTGYKWHFRPTRLGELMRQLAQMTPQQLGISEQDKLKMVLEQQRLEAERGQKEHETGGRREIQEASGETPGESPKPPRRRSSSGKKKVRPPQDG